MSLSQRIAHARAAAAQGFGDVSWGNIGIEYPDGTPTQDPFPTDSSGGGSGGGGSSNQAPPWYVSLEPVLLGGEKLASNIWGNQYQQPTYQPIRTTLPANYGSTYNTVPNPGGGIGIGVDSRGIRLSDGSHIGWFPIIGVGFGLFLLQSKGFSRR
jgi:hypothetical protein